MQTTITCHHPTPLPNYMPHGADTATIQLNPATVNAQNKSTRIRKNREQSVKLLKNFYHLTKESQFNSLK